MSATHADEGAAANAVDGDGATLWGTTGDTNALTIELPSAAAVCPVRVVYEGASAYEVQVQVADSAGGPWSTAATDENPGWLGSKPEGDRLTQTTYLPLLPPTTHVRLAILSAATVYGVKAYSVELYGQGAFPPLRFKPPSPPRPPTAPPCVFSSASMMDHAAVSDSIVSASDSEPGDREPENAVDGSDGTRWASGPASGLTDGEAWLRLDFSQALDVCRLVVRWRRRRRRSTMCSWASTMQAPSGRRWRR